MMERLQIPRFHRAVVAPLVAVVLAATASPRLFEHGINVVHFTQSLEKWDQVQQLSVGHVVEPGRHGNLDSGRKIYPKYVLHSRESFP